MKINKVLVSLFAAGVISSPLAHATNGAVMMAVGSQNTALGGSGVAHFVGAESTFANPAMLGKSQGDEVTGGVVLFNADVTNDGMSGGTVVGTSDAKTSYIPDVSYSSRISDNLTYGVALAGIAGMGVDYTSTNPMTHMKAKTALSILKVVPTISYNADGFGVGFSPVFQSGSLMISYANSGGAYNADETASKDTGFGYTLGGYMNATPELTVAAAYQSAIKMEYGTQLSGAGAGFGLMVGGFGAPFGDTLTQPAEMKLGAAYAMGNMSFALDYKVIQYGQADGWKDFNWKDQAVIAIGGKYAGEGYWVGLGYNKADDQIGRAHV